MERNCLSKKRKEKFVEIFARCHISMLYIDLIVLKFNQQAVDSQIKKQLIDEHNRFRKSNQHMFAYLKDNEKTPNYQMLNSIYEYFLKEVETLKEKLSGKHNKNPNFYKRTVFCYVHRLDTLYDQVYYAGTKSLNDLYSKRNGSVEWELLNFYTEELIYNSEQVCRQNYEKLQQLFKKFQISVYKSDKLLPGQQSEEFDKFLKTELDEMKSGGQFGKSIAELKKKVTLKFSKIFPEMVASMLSNKSKIDDDFEQVLAAPKFEVLRNTMLLENNDKVKTVKKMFMDENIKTNRMLNISANAFQAILKIDTVSKLDEKSSNTVRPFMAKDCEELIIEAKDLLPSNMNKLIDENVIIKEDIQIRLLSVRDLENIEDYISDKKFEKRIVNKDEWEFQQLDDYNKEGVNFGDRESPVKLRTKSTMKKTLNTEKNSTKSPQKSPTKSPQKRNTMNYSPNILEDLVKFGKTKKELIKEKNKNTSLLKLRLVNQIYLDDDYEVDMHIQNKSPPTYHKKLNLINLSSENNKIFIKDVSLKEHFRTVMIHIHGGGFVGFSSSSHLLYLIPWAKKLNIPIFSIDYRLASTTIHYPTPVNDSIAGYLWVQLFVEKVLQVKIETLIISGDSAGGNQAFAVTNWCIINGIRAPDFIFASYPSIQMNTNYYTPSQQLSMNDAIVNYSFCKMVLKYYIPEGKNCGQDSFMSTYGTPDWVLKQYPRVSIGICEYDVTRDDSFRFAYRLLNLDREVKIYYNRFMPHGLLNMSTSTDIPEASKWRDKSYEILLDYINERRVLLACKTFVQLTERRGYLNEEEE